MTAINRSLALVVASLALAGSAQAAAASADAQAKISAGVAKVYDTSRLHRIDIVIAPVDAPKMIQKLDARFKCTFTFDGIELKDVGIRQAGGWAHPYVPINGKPSLSIKFDEFVEGQELHGLEKIVLKNALQDNSFVNEHLTYEVFRRAGLAAPYTAHAHVTINGVDLGVYIMREPVNKQFLTRNFGKENNDGNLYEIGSLRIADVAMDPGNIELKDEKEDGRKRDDIMRLAAILTAPIPNEHVRAAINTSVDLDRYLTFWAVEGVTSYMDGFTFHSNNSYMYALPKDGRFVFIPHGADETFWAGVSGVTFMRSPLQPPFSSLPRKLVAIPDVSAKLRSEVKRVAGPEVWDKAALHARVAQFEKILTDAPRTPRLTSDLARFNRYRQTIREFIDSAGTSGAAN